MKKIIKYECEICRRQFKTECDCKNCEDMGEAPPYPIGCIYENPFYEDITFAVAHNNHDGHANFGSSWACRDNGYGDSLGVNQCGGVSLKLNKNNNVDPTTPHFKRMVKWLRSQSIDITVWDGEKAVRAPQG